MSLPAAPLSSEIAAVAAASDGSLTLGLRLLHPGESFENLSLRLSKEQVERLAMALRLREIGPCDVGFPVASDEQKGASA